MAIIQFVRLNLLPNWLFWRIAVIGESFCFTHFEVMIHFRGFPSVVRRPWRPEWSAFDSREGCSMVDNWVLMQLPGNEVKYVQDNLDYLWVIEISSVDVEISL